MKCAGLLTPVSGVAWEPTVPPLDFEIEAVSEASDRWKGSDQGSWRVTRAVALHRRLFLCYQRVHAVVGRAWSAATGAIERR